MKSIAVLGSTGSIGCNTLKVVEHLKSEFRVVALGAGRNTEKLAEQIEKFQPELVSVETEMCAEELLRRISKFKFQIPRIEIGEPGLVSCATHEKAEAIVSATVGAVGFVPTLRALEAGKRVALANKETFVMAGELMREAARKNNAEILPVDSEHNAIHQCLRGETKQEVKRLILTASGGPFRQKSEQEIENATVAEALNHPNWKMGKKNTIDSATLMNKGLEVIEASRLFDFSADEIAVVVHPQSIVHSFVEMVDGSIIAQMGVTDMKHAIQYALTFPARKANCLPPLDFATLAQLTFEQPDLEKFPCLRLAYEALKIGGTMTTVLNAANEIAVEAFLGNKISLSDIPKIIETVMNEHESQPAQSLEIILETDDWARKQAVKMLEQFRRTASAN